MAPVAVLHVPHASTLVPPDLRAHLLVDDAALEEELLRMTDRFTDELFHLPAAEATTIRFPVSRLVVDPERFLDDALEPMAKRGMGVIYIRRSDGRPLRATPSEDERNALIDRFYHRHHRALASAVRSAVDDHGHCLIIDCHSFPSVALPCDPDQSPGRPDICIGTDPFHTPHALASRAAELFAAAGLSVDTNKPYAGALVPAEDYGQRKEVSSLMIEVNRKLYMDETTGKKHPDFDRVSDTVRRVVRELIACFRSDRP